MKFDAAAHGRSAGEHDEPVFVLDPASDKSARGVEWIMGNGLFATELPFLVRMSRVGKLRAIQFDH